MLPGTDTEQLFEARVLNGGVVETNKRSKRSYMDRLACRAETREAYFQGGQVAASQYTFYKAQAGGATNASQTSQRFGANFAELKSLTQVRQCRLIAEVGEDFDGLSTSLHVAAAQVPRELLDIVTDATLEDDLDHMTPADDLGGTSRLSRVVDRLDRDVQMQLHVVAPLIGELKVTAQLVACAELLPGRKSSTLR